MPDTEPVDPMPLLRTDTTPLHGRAPIQQHLGRQLRAMYDAVPLPEDPHLDALVRQLEPIPDA